MELLASLVDGAIATGCIICNWFGGNCVGLGCVMALPGLFGLGLGAAGAMGTALATSLFGGGIHEPPVSAGAEDEGDVTSTEYVPDAPEPPDADHPAEGPRARPSYTPYRTTPDFLHGERYFPGFSPRPPDGVVYRQSPGTHYPPVDYIKEEVGPSGWPIHVTIGPPDSGERATAAETDAGRG